MSADNVRGWEIVRKMNIWPRSEASRANVKFWGQSLSQGHYQPTYCQARKGFIYFITLPIIFISYRNRLLKASIDQTTNGRNCWERVNLNGLTIFPLWLDQKLTVCDDKLNFCSVPKYLAFFSASVFYCLFWNNISDKLSNVTISRLYKKVRFCSMYNNKHENWNSRAGFFPASFAFLSGNQRRRTNIKSDGGYCVITVQHVT